MLPLVLTRGQRRLQFLFGIALAGGFAALKGVPYAVSTNLWLCPICYKV